MLRRFLQWAIIIDEKVNRILGGRKHETLSARSARHSHKPGWKQLRYLLDLPFPGHTDDALRHHFKRRRKK